DLERLSAVCDSLVTMYTVTHEFANLTGYVDEIMNQLPVGILNIHPSENRVVLNPTARDILRIGSEWKHLDKFQAYLDDLSGAQELNELIQNISVESSPEYSEFEIDIEEENPVVVEAIASVVESVEGEETRILVVLTDVTEQRMLNRRMNRTERLAALGELASSLAHEIKNPLTSIQGFVQLIPERDDDPEFLEKTSNIIRRETQRLNELVENLLSFGKPQVSTRSNVDLSRLIEDTHMLFEKRLEEQEIEFQRDVNDGITVYGDEAKLKQVILNICINALDAMPDGGTLEIEANDLGNERVELIFEDTGHGIPDDQLSRVFNPFYTSKDEGTGLGLAISHRIIEEHDGSLSISSETGKGTTVEIEIPTQQHHTTQVTEDQT
ncbi:MAG: nitrogen regulation protein NR(II), partial [bacterium]